MRHLNRFFIILSLAWVSALNAQTGNEAVEKRVKEYFAHCTLTANTNQPTIKEINIDNEKRRITITANSNLAYQPFTPKSVDKLYSDIKGVLPAQYKSYTLCIYSDEKPVEELIPNILRSKKDKSRLSLHIDYKGEPWVSNTSRQYEVTKGLQNRHIVVWQSHGRYYMNDKDKWGWQRPNLFCTNEDLFTKSFTVPYIIPMLENAGAYVYTPRERDSQRNEIIVDNDTRNGSLYVEEKSHKGKWKDCEQSGFANLKSIYSDNENPFESGTARFVKTEKKENKAFAEWIPNIPESGEYAVYVSYQTQENSVSDAKYIVFHQGGISEFKVNQKMGGGTWVYLGTFYFNKGRNATGMVILSNYSKESGVVCADAVRFGGGMGNIERGGSVSGLPRNLEGARYSTQWSGMPYSVYGGRGGENDYADDINTRSLSMNYLSGGSVYNPAEDGLGVPFELSLATHSDAGYKVNDELVGTLGIYTTDFNDGKLNSGVDRYASRDLADIILTQIQSDIQSTFNQPWARRAMWNRNYSETRLPAVPSAIVEMLSHQNFADMRYGHDPNFKFTVGRAIYKAVLKFICEQHNRDYVVQPLPVSHFAIKQEENDKICLSWRGVNDATEPTARPKEYIVYTAIGRNGFDNGVRVKSNEYTTTLTPGLIYSFKVTAVNAGGESFPSETLSAYKSPNEAATVLVVNAFNRLSGPAQLNNETEGGFDIYSDPGVAYIYNQSYCGNQIVTQRKQAGKDGDKMWGYSGNEIEGMKIAGNTFDYPYVHGEAIRGAGKYSFISCSDEAVEDGIVALEDYSVVDIIYGLEKDASYNMKFYKTFSQKMQHAISAYRIHGGGLLVSGAYIGSDMNATDGQREFIAKELHFTLGGELTDKSVNEIDGLGMKLTIPRHVNEHIYSVPSADCLQPTSGAFTALVYGNGIGSAAIAYQGDCNTFAMGFPFESIESSSDRTTLMSSILNFLTKH